MALMRTVPFDARETPSSLAARLAVANGVPPRDFARDMRISLPALDCGDTMALATLSKLGGIPVADLRSNSMLRREDGVWVGEEKLSLRNIACKKQRVCPACLQEDLEAGREAKLEARPRCRVAWKVPFVLTCPAHQCLLIAPPELAADSTSTIPDAMRRFPRWLHRLVKSTTATPLSPLEIWLAKRLGGEKTDGGLLEQLPFYVGARLANVTGWSMAFGEQGWTSLTDIEKVEAGAIGYALLQFPLEEFLDEVRGHLNGPESGGEKPRSRQFMAWLRANLQNPDYSLLLDWVREDGIDHQPIGPGDTFLGPVTRRSLHSIHSASREYGLHPKRLRKLLLHSGIIRSETAGMSDQNVVFRVETANDLLEAAANAMVGDDVRIYLGMTRVQWDQIRKAKFLKTLFPENANTLRAYSRAELDRFLASVRYEKGIRNGECEHTFVSVAKATKFAVCGYIDIVTLLQAGQLDRVSINWSRRGFAGVLVDPHEVRRKVAPRTVVPGLTARQAAKRMGVRIETVHALTLMGVLPSFVHQTYRNARQSRLIRSADISEFLAEHMPLSEVAERLGYPGWPRHACAIMDEHGVVRAFTTETVRTVIYRRADVEPILARI